MERQHGRVIKPRGGTLGLTQLHPDPNDTEAANRKTIDVIALHGLAAKSPDTWIAWTKDGDPASGHVNWLQDSHMLPSVMTDARILTYDWDANYVGDASRDLFLGHADSLLDLISLNRKDANRSDHPIIFIASCFGGLLLAKALVRASERFHANYDRFDRILNSTVGVAFLGTPFRGSWRTGYVNAKLWCDLAQREKAAYSQELVQYLRSDSRSDGGGAPSPLDELVQKFTEMTQHDAFKFPITCFYETRDARFSSYLARFPANFQQKQIDPDGHDITVPESSACIDSAERVGLPVRHCMLQKHRSPDGIGFVRISQRLKEFADKSDEVLKRRAKHRLELAITPSVKIVDWIEPSDFSSQHRRISKLREPGTCNWFLQSDSFHQWRDNPCRTLICPGIPGAGKTVMVSAVIEHLADSASRTRGAALAYVYCEFGLQNVQTATYLLGNLLKQLVRTCSSIPQELKAVLAKPQTDKRQLNWSEASMAIRLVAATYPRVFIVVDSLDECRTLERNKLLNELFELQKRCNVNLFATSRFVDDIQERFKDVGYLPIRAAREDVALYVQGQIDQVSGFLERQRPEFKKEIADAISYASDGMFLLATRYLYSLQDKLRVTDTRAALDRFRQARQRFSDDSELAEMLTDDYSKLVTRINSQPLDHRRLAKYVLTWVAFAKRSLTAEEIRHALAADMGRQLSPVGKDDLYDIPDVVSVCAGLVTFEEVSNTARVRHYAVQNFIEAKISAIDGGPDESRQMSAPGSALRVAHGQLALACITYLSFTAFQNGRHNAGTEPKGRLEAYPLYEYAAGNWSYHAQIASLVQKGGTALRSFQNQPTAASYQIRDCEACHTSVVNLPASFHNLAFRGGLHLRPPPRAVSALRNAVYSRIADIVKILLDNGYDLTSLGDDLLTSVGLAIMEGDRDIIRRRSDV